MHFPTCNADHRIKSFWLIPFASPPEFVVGKQVQRFFLLATPAQAPEPFSGAKNLRFILARYTFLVLCSVASIRENSVWGIKKTQHHSLNATANKAFKPTAFGCGLRRRYVAIQITFAGVITLHKYHDLRVFAQKRHYYCL